MPINTKKLIIEVEGEKIELTIPYGIRTQVTKSRDYV